MEEISVLIEMLEHAGIKYNVDQLTDEDGQRILEVNIYDKNDNIAVFEFDAYDLPDLIDFKIL